jgi:hypothetical protein
MADFWEYDNFKGLNMSMIKRYVYEPKCEDSKEVAVIDIYWLGGGPLDRFYGEEAKDIYNAIEEYSEQNNEVVIN